ncbi:MAG: FAD-dependent oxidoreductase, partial [Armatimonadetes bacterium]
MVVATLEPGIAPVANAESSRMTRRSGARSFRMKVPEAVPLVRLKTERRSNHPWIFQKMVEKPDPKPRPGTVVDIEDRSGAWVGRGFYNGHSRIALRVLTGQVFQCAAFLRKAVPGFGDASISGMSPRIGIRETRRLVGEYVLTGDDLRRGARFPDSVAVGCWPIDVHPAPGVVG